MPVMNDQIFYIRSLTAQNLIMGIITALLAIILFRTLVKGRFRHAAATFVWSAIVLWFFNGPLWGFSSVTVSRAGLRIHYGFLSFYKNTRLPPDTNWEIHVYMGGLRRSKKLYYFQLADHKSLKVRGLEHLAGLQDLGASIDRLNDKRMGKLDRRPVNIR